MSSENEKTEQEDIKKIDKSKHTVMIILGLTGIVLILTGFCIGAFFDFINITVGKTTLYILKMAFYASGFFDFWMVNYIRKNL